MKHRNRNALCWTPAIILLAAGSTHSLAGGGFPATLNMTSLDGTNGFTCQGIDNSDMSGQSVSSAGDVNGDGYDDLIIGAWGGDPNGNSSGESYVLFGGPGVGAGGAIPLSSLNGANGFVLNGVDSGDDSGRSLAGAGDVNGDGFDDLIIGADSADPGSPQVRFGAGETYVVFGSGTIGASGSIELSSLNGTNGFVCNGISSGDSTGYAVSSAGDVNGDGFDDMLIGGFYVDSGYQEYGGAAYVVFGGATVGSSGSIELSSLNGTNGFACLGTEMFDTLGRSLSAAGDVNDDGIDDLIIGAYGRGLGGESFVLFGDASVGASGEVDVDDLDGTDGFVCIAVDSSDQCGAAISSAGDVNGDGIDDLIIGARNGDPNGNTWAGESYVVFGNANLGAGGVFELSTLNGANGFVCNGVAENDHSGNAVSAAGDVNADGFGDIIIAASNAWSGGIERAGECYIVFGRADIGASGAIDLVTLNGSNGFTCVGTIFSNQLGVAVSPAGDMNDDGIDDFILGSGRASPNGMNGAGESYVVFGRQCELTADVNGDASVDTADLGVLVGQFGSTGAGLTADINGDSVVDTADLGALIGEFGLSCL